MKVRKGLQIAGDDFFITWLRQQVNNQGNEREIFYDEKTIFFIASFYFRRLIFKMVFWRRANYI